MPFLETYQAIFNERKLGLGPTHVKVKVIDIDQY